MIQEEKFEEAKKLYKDANADQRYVLERIFPELKESDDEKIRKNCIHFLELQKSHHASTVEIDEFIAWLEQQGEQKPTQEIEPTPIFKIGNILKRKGKDYTFRVDRIQGGYYHCDRNHGAFFPIEEQCNWELVEQNPIDKVKTKFNEGDWIVQENIGVYKVIEICESWYEVIDGEDNHYSISFDKEHMCRLWDITKDANDGDVLVHSSFIFIYNNTSILQAYCYYSRNRFIIEDRGHQCPWNMQEVTPETKEQRDILMKAMAHAKYTFDFEKKELKKIEQKSNDKVEPKFKVGDYVVDNCGYVWRIEGILNELYILEGIDGGESRPTIEWVNKTFHLWDITKDAKDGDVLVAKGEYFKEYIFIYSKMTDDDVISTHCGYDVIRNNFDTRLTRFGRMEDFEAVYPATIKQCEQLEKAMAEASYEFDFEKKELKKIEQTPAENSNKPSDWSKEDEAHFDSILKRCTPGTIYTSTGFLISEDINWLKSLKERVGNFDDGYNVGFSAAKHNQWKPSDEQMKAFEFFIRSWGESGAVIAQDSTYNQMRSLYEDLKNLK